MAPFTHRHPFLSIAIGLAGWGLILLIMWLSGARIF